MIKEKNRWFSQHGYVQGIFWITLVALISSSNDVFIRLIGTRLPSMQITFFRFFFAFLILLPIMFYKNKKIFQTSHLKLHILRCLIGFGSIAFWCAGVSSVPLVIVSTLSLTVPLFILPMSIVFLGENIKWQRAAATLSGFFGITIIVNGTEKTQGIIHSIQFTDKGILFLISATILFALSDILNKKMVIKESNLTMLFYFAFGTSLCGAIPAYMLWKTPTFSELCYLFCLGIGGNLILYCLLKALSATEVSALAPYRYFELFFSCFFGWILFIETPTTTTILGALIIVSSTFSIAYYEKRKQGSLLPNTLGGYPTRPIEKFHEIL